MVIDYSNPTTRFIHRSPAVVTAFASVFAAALAAWCVFHVIQAQELIANAPQSFCGNCQAAINKQLAISIGVPVNNAISLGFLCGGVSLVLGIQTIRFLNAGRSVPPIE